MTDEQRAKDRPSPGHRDDILGQYCFALGRGAGAFRVRASTIRALRLRYGPPLDHILATDPDWWTEHRHHVLDLVVGVGRLAARIEADQGSITVGPDAFTTAADIVERTVGRRIELVTVGKACRPRSS